MELDDLIKQVRDDAITEDPLDLVAAAMGVKAELDELTDSLIGHFVDQARRSGSSWSEIGAAMGVTKQAAQQRHTTERPKREKPWRFGQRFTDRARRVVREAQNAAVELGHDHLGTEHLLLGILDSPRCLAARVLADAGFGRAQVMAAIGATETRLPGGRRRHLPFTPRAKAAMERALANALRLGHNYIGTEHILLGLFDDPEGYAAKAMTDAGLTKAQVESAIIERLLAA